MTRSIGFNRTKQQKTIMSNYLKTAMAKISKAVQGAGHEKAPKAPEVGVAKKMPGPDPAPTEALLAWHRPLKNPRLLIAYRAGTDPTNPNNLVSVNVRNNVNFLPHMKLRVARVSATVYDLVGPLPRWRGRW